MIAVESVSKSFGPVQALRSLSFEVPTGSICGFLGPNGAGKTTLLRILAGILVADSGIVRRGGSGVGGLGYLADGAPLPTDLTVEEYLRFCALLLGVAAARRRESVARALEQCALQEVRQRLVGDLSRGFRQRTALAGALVHQPAVLLLDEPSSGLDPRQSAQFRALLRSLSGQCTVLLSSHNLSEVEASCDRAVIVSQGRAVACGSLDELRRGGALLAEMVIETDRSDAGLLAALPELRAIRVEALAAPWHRMTIQAPAGADALCEAAATALRDSGATVRRLQWCEPTLEDVCARLLGQDEAK